MTIVHPSPQIDVINLTRRLSLLSASPALATVVETDDTCPRCAANLMKIEGDQAGCRFCAFCGWNNGGA